MKNVLSSFCNLSGLQVSKLKSFSLRKEMAILLGVPIVNGLAKYLGTYIDNYKDMKIIKQEILQET